MAKKVYGMFFTGTGTTEKMVTYIAKELAKELGCDYEPYDFTLPAVRKTVKEYTADDIVVLGTPVIAGRVPNLLLKYLDTVVGNGAYGIPVVLYGNRNFDDALIELRNIMEADGFHTIAGGAFVGEHSFSRTLGQGRPDEEDMAVAANCVRNNNGGFAIALDGKIIGELPLPLAGLMCDKSVEEVTEIMDNLHKTAAELGVNPEIDPFMTLGFVSLTVIPEIRLTTTGIVEV